MILLRVSDNSSRHIGSGAPIDRRRHLRHIASSVAQFANIGRKWHHRVARRVIIDLALRRLSMPLHFHAIASSFA